MHTHTPYIHELRCILHNAVQSIQVRESLHHGFVIRCEGVLTEGLNEVVNPLCPAGPQSQAAHQSLTLRVADIKEAYVVEN